MVCKNSQMLSVFSCRTFLKTLIATFIYSHIICFRGEMTLALKKSPLQTTDIMDVFVNELERT